MRIIKILLILVTALLVSAILPVFNKDHILDFGNSSDIISSLCNITMAGAAIYAAFRANEWLSQKMDEHAFNIAKDLISSDFPRIGRQLRELLVHLNSCFGHVMLNEVDQALLILEKHRNENTEKIKELFLASEEIPHKIESLFKLGWDIKKKNHYQLYMKTVSSQYRCFSILEELYNELDIVLRYSNKKIYNSEVLFNMANKLFDIFDKFVDAHGHYSLTYDEFISNNMTVPEYFEIRPLIIKKVSK